jgi:NAD(P)-dependent dehydrogenase (short-subunit alcohol dehydrogenase family)
MSLNGKVVLISGAARGIGAQTAREVVRRGGKVALVGLEPDRLAELTAELGDERAASWEADVTDLATVEEAVAAAAEHFGGIDIVMANAGIAPFGTVGTMDPAAFKATIDINVTGVYYTVHAALSHVVARRGYVLVVASAASFAPMLGGSAYGASKAGAEAFAVALAGEVAHKGVDVGILHPSWIDTDMVRDAEHDLEAFAKMRAQMPWPVKTTTSVEACATAVVDGMEARAARIFVPRSIALIRALRNVLGSRAGIKGASRRAAPLLDELDATTRRLGRSVSERAERLNRT